MDAASGWRDVSPWGGGSLHTFSCPSSYEAAAENYEKKDFKIIGDIIRRAEAKAKWSNVPSGDISLSELLEAYDAVLRQHNVVPEEDCHYYRFLLKLSLEPYDNWWALLQAEQLIATGCSDPLLPSQTHIHSHRSSSAGPSFRAAEPNYWDTPDSRMHFGGTQPSVQQQQQRSHSSQPRSQTDPSSSAFQHAIPAVRYPNAHSSMKLPSGSFGHHADEGSAKTAQSNKAPITLKRSRPSHSAHLAHEASHARMPAVYRLQQAASVQRWKIEQPFAAAPVPVEHPAAWKNAVAPAQEARLHPQDGGQQQTWQVSADVLFQPWQHNQPHVTAPFTSTSQTVHSSEASSAAGDLHRSADVRRDEESLSQKSMPAVSGMPGESSQRGLEFTKAEQQALRHYLLCSKSFKSWRQVVRVHAQAAMIRDSAVTKWKSALAFWETRLCSRILHTWYHLPGALHLLAEDCRTDFLLFRSFHAWQRGVHRRQKHAARAAEHDMLRCVRWAVAHWTDNAQALREQRDLSHVASLHCRYACLKGAMRALIANRQNAKELEGYAEKYHAECMQLSSFKAWWGAVEASKRLKGKLSEHFEKSRMRKLSKAFRIWMSFAAHEHLTREIEQAALQWTGQRRMVRCLSAWRLLTVSQLQQQQARLEAAATKRSHVVLQCTFSHWQSFTEHRRTLAEAQRRIQALESQRYHNETLQLWIHVTEARYRLYRLEATVQKLFLRRCLIVWLRIVQASKTRRLQSQALAADQQAKEQRRILSMWRNCAQHSHTRVQQQSTTDSATASDDRKVNVANPITPLQDHGQEQLTAAFHKLQNHTHSSRAARASFMLFAQKWSLSSMHAAFHALVANMRKRQLKRRAMHRSITHRNRRCLALALVAWIEHASRAAQKRENARMSHMNRQRWLVYSAFVAWLEYCLQRSRKKAMHERASRTFYCKRVKMTWHAWKWFCARRVSKRMHVQHACAQLHAKRLRCLLHVWLQSAQGCRKEMSADLHCRDRIKRQAFDLWKSTSYVQQSCRILTHSSDSKLAETVLLLWRQVVLQAVRERSSMQRAVAAHTRITNAKVFATWLWDSEEIKAKRQKLQAAVQYMQTYRLGVLWAVWVQRAAWLWCKRQQNSAAAAWRKSCILRRGMLAWVRAVALAARKRAMNLTAAEKCRRTNTVKCFHAWHTWTKAERKKQAQLVAMHVRHEMRLLEQAMENWKFHTQLKKHHTHVLEQTDSRLKLVCVAHWRDEVLPAAQRIHAAHALCATHKAKHFTRILLSWRAYAAARAFKNTLSAHARAHRSQCILMHGWHALKQHRDIAKHKKELIRRAESHSKEMVVNRVWELWEQLVDMERKEVSAAMHREQVVALRGLRAFSESLHRRYTKRLAATHYRLSFQNLTLLGWHQAASYRRHTLCKISESLALASEHHTARSALIHWHQACEDNLASRLASTQATAHCNIQRLVKCMCRWKQFAAKSWQLKACFSDVTALCRSWTLHNCCSSWRLYIRQCRISAAAATDLTSQSQFHALAHTLGIWRWQLTNKKASRARNRAATFLHRKTLLKRAVSSLRSNVQECKLTRQCTTVLNIRKCMRIMHAWHNEADVVRVRNELAEARCNARRLQANNKALRRGLVGLRTWAVRQKGCQMLLCKVLNRRMHRAFAEWAHVALTRSAAALILARRLFRVLRVCFAHWMRHAFTRAGAALLLQRRYTAIQHHLLSHWRIVAAGRRYRTHQLQKIQALLAAQPQQLGTTAQRAVRRLRVGPHVTPAFSKWHSVYAHKRAKSAWVAKHVAQMQHAQLARVFKAWRSCVDYSTRAQLTGIRMEGHVCCDLVETTVHAWRDSLKSALLHADSRAAACSHHSNCLALKVMRAWHSCSAALSQARCCADERFAAAEVGLQRSAVYTWRTCTRNAIRARAHAELAVLHSVRSQQARVLQAWRLIIRTRQTKVAATQAAVKHFHTSCIARAFAHWRFCTSKKSCVAGSLYDMHARMHTMHVVDTLNNWRSAASEISTHRGQLPVALRHRNQTLLAGALKSCSDVAKFNRRRTSTAEKVAELAATGSANTSLATWQHNLRNTQAQNAAIDAFHAKSVSRMLKRVFAKWRDTLEESKLARLAADELFSIRSKEKMLAMFREWRRCAQCSRRERMCIESALVHWTLRLMRSVLESWRTQAQLTRACQGHNSSLVAKAWYAWYKYTGNMAAAKSVLAEDFRCKTLQSVVLLGWRAVVIATQQHAESKLASRMHYQWALCHRAWAAWKEYLNRCRNLELIALERSARIHKHALHSWAKVANSLKSHRQHHTTLTESTATRTATELITSWNSFHRASQLRCKLLQRRALHAWAARIAHKVYWRNALNHARSVMQEAACMRCFLAWRERVWSMQARLAAFMRRQHALRAALAAGRALTKLHHSELSAVCIHAWHAYSSRQAGARRLQQKSSTRVVTKCWNVWVMHVVHARTVDRALASLEASRRRKTLRKVLEGWRGVVLASEKAREDAAVATVKHMHEWRKCTVFVAWVSLTEKHQKLARRFLGAMQHAVILRARKLRCNAWTAWMYAMAQRRRHEAVALQAALDREAKLLDTCFDTWCRFTRAMTHEVRPESPFSSPRRQSQDERTLKHLAFLSGTLRSRLGSPTGQDSDPHDSVDASSEDSLGGVRRRLTFEQNGLFGFQTVGSGGHSSEDD